MNIELPIVAIRDSFLSAMLESSPIVVVAPTGSGKSTQLPIWMEESCDGVVMVVEPRRIACLALAGFVASLYGEKVGQTVGYRIRFDSAISRKTKIEFVTPGVALRVLRGEQRDRYKAVLIDEFHERHWEVDLLVMLLRAESEQPNPPKLVLTSATVAGEEVAQQIQGILLEAEGRTYPVTTSYLTDVSGPTRRDLEERVAQGVKHILRTETSEDVGDILVFLPGKGEIDACQKELSQALNPGLFDMVPVHGELSTDKLSRALKNDQGKRRIFLATNVAETSLTLPRVTVVIDSGLARMRIHRSGRSALALVAIPEALMMQRAGRAGRVAPGRCLRLWQESYRPEPYLKPEIERVELDDMLIQAASHGWDGSKIADAPWVTPPPTFSLEQSIQHLQWMGAFDELGHNTDLGSSLAHWPVSVHEATLLVGAPASLQGTLADIVALLQQRRSLMLPAFVISSDKRDDVVEDRRLLLSGCNNEVYAELRCLRYGQVNQHGLHHSALRHSRSVAKQLRQRLKLPCKDPTQDNEPLPPLNELAKWLLTRMPSLGFVLRPRAKGEKAQRPPKKGRPRKPEHPWANGEIEVMVEPFEPIEPGPSWRAPISGVIFVHAWIGDRGLKVRGKGRMLLPCSPETFAEAGLGDTTFEEPKLSKKKGGVRIVASLSQKLADVTLRSEVVPLTGEPLCLAAAQFLLDKRWLKGAKDEILDDLHLLKLLHEWPSADRTWKDVPEMFHVWDEPIAWIAQSLFSLGVEESSDLSLIAVDDLRPNFSSIIDLDPYTLEEMRRDFPRLWSLHGATYRCDIRPRQHKVELHPDNSVARKGKDPLAQWVPRFRGFQVDYRRASRLVSIRKR